MKKLKIILSIILVFILINTSFALEETSNINWKRWQISKIYNENTKKLSFLLQFKIDKKPDLDYEFYIKINTSERKRTCEWNFIYTKNAIYTVCSIRINDKITLDKKINFYFNVEKKNNWETQIEEYKNINILKNVKTFDWILWEDNLDKINFNSKVVDLDVFDTDKKIIDNLKSEWKIVIWYINVWSIEKYRDDYNDFPKSVVWKTYPWWEDEKFLDIRKYKKFQELILNRLDIAKEKWFDGIEPDNMDTYDNYNETGFNIYQWNSEEYLIWLSQEVNKRWMFLIQKNAPELSERMQKYFDGALLEGAFYNKFEDKFLNYTKNWKTVFNVEYTDNTNKKEFLENICPKSKKIWFISILKNRDLDKYILSCEDKENLNKNIMSSKKDEEINKKINKITRLEEKIKNIIHKYLLEKQNKLKTINLLLEKIENIKVTEKNREIIEILEKVLLEEKE